MRDLRPREIPVSLNQAPLFLPYSDGEGETAGVGITLWMPNGKSICGNLHIPDVVRRVWSRSAECGEHYDIYEIEAIGPCLVLHNIRHIMPEV